MIFGLKKCPKIGLNLHMKSRVTILSLNLTRAASAAAIIAGAICRAGPPNSAAEVARRLQRFRYAVQMHVKKNTNLGT